MKLSEFYLKDFRNYQGQRLTFQEPVIVFYGDNAQGKTNLLEALYFLATGKSHRAQKERDLVRWGSSGFYLQGKLKKSSTEYMLEVISRTGAGSNQEKILKVDYLTQSKLKHFLNTFNVVIFSPEDLNLVKGEPEGRRKFLDQEIIQVDPSYGNYTRHYARALRQRNQLLKNNLDRNYLNQVLPSWDKQLAYYGTQIVLKRKKIIKKMKLLGRLLYRKLTGQSEDLDIQYMSSPIWFSEIEADRYALKDLNQHYYDYLVENREKDVSKKVTTVGPHRDDLHFYIQGKNARIYGSQGQQRTTILALKLAELEMIKGEKGEYPVLLMDDVLSELDKHRRNYLLNITLGQVQTFVTGTMIEDFDPHMLDKAQIYKICEGKAVHADARH